MNFEYLQEFLICAKLKNFTKAANTLFITQSALSKHIAILENEIGTELFIRSTPISLTNAGNYFFSRLEPFLQEYDSIIKNTKALGKNHSGNLGIGMLYYTKEVIMPTVIKFANSYPDIKLHYLSSTPNEIINGVFSRSIDIACIQRLNFKKADVLSYYDLYNEPFLYLFSKNHRLSTHDKISISEIITENYIHIDDDFYSAYLEYINERLKKYNFVLTPKYTVSNLEELFLAIELNQGFGIVAKALKSVDLGGMFKYIDPVEDDLYFIRSLLYLKDNNNPTLPLFIDTLKQ